jgi:hypothetical protein
MSQVVKVIQFVKPVFSVPNIPKQILAESSTPYSPGFKNGTRSIHTGLTFAEQSFLLPSLIGISANSPDFQKAVDDYYCEFSRTIPADGMDLDVSYTQNGNNQIPVNIEDYLLSKLMWDDKNVGKTEEEIENSSFYDFVIIDKDKMDKIEDEMHEKRKLAAINMVALYEQPEKIKYIVTILRKYAKVKSSNIDTRIEASLDGLTVMEVESMSDSKLEAALVIIKDIVPDKFNKLVTDENLAVKALIAAAIEFNFLSSLNGEFYYEEEKIATTYKSLIGTIKKDNNMIAILTEKVGVIKSELGK